MGYRDSGHASDFFGGIDEATGGVEFRPKTEAERLDDHLRQAVSEALARDSRLMGARIDVFVKRAEVTLRGQIPKADLGAIAEEHARSVSGVTSIQNELTVSADRS
jgi:osmotically-inducible protein OsmY